MRTIKYLVFSKMFILILLIFEVNKSIAQNKRGYIIIFGCCYNNDSVRLKSSQKIYFSGNVNTESSTSIDINHSFFISSYNNKKVEIILGLKKIEVFLKKINDIQYLYIFNYNDSLYTNLTSTLLYAQ